jgi:glyoxylase-like metal-dependent hydrolase (beta-lactamase superfamily II)/rhodanese-related sulfurtransferase
MTLPLIEIHAVVDEGLGHLSYVVGLGAGTALVVDPARFTDRQRTIAAQRGWRIAWTADTHSHADYISGSTELAATGATFLASEGARLESKHRPLEPDDVVALADGVELRAIATPGHTPDHLAYLLSVGGREEALFSGGSLMVGSVGRTDLLGDEQREALARALFRSLREHVLTLPDDLRVYPTHGAGSFCSAPAGAALTTTVGRERATNALLQIDDEDAFVAALIAGLGRFPTYFRQLPEINRVGPRVYTTLPTLERLDVDSVRNYVEQGAQLVDARTIEAFGAAHIPGSLSIQQRSVFASWFGWLIPLDTPVVFVLDDDNDRADLVRQALTIGHERLLGELAGGTDAWRAAGYEVASIPLVRPDQLEGLALDVRQLDEWRGGHLPDARHVELGALAESTISPAPITVLCGHGERAMTGASLLERVGHRDLHVLVGGPEEVATAHGTTLVRD